MPSPSSSPRAPETPEESPVDDVLAELSAFAVELRLDQVGDDAVEAAQRRVLDSLACALGGLDSPAARAARQAAPAADEARIWGGEQRSSVADAGFANGVALRYLDFNDTGGGHPSDVLGTLLACAESVGAPGSRLLEGMIISYECQLTLWDQLRPEPAGVDQGIGAVVGSAAGCAHLLGLDQHAAAQAIAIAVVSSVPLAAVRHGELSWWKAAAVPHAARQGYVAARLAEEGFTGPERAFAGQGGLLGLLGTEARGPLLRHHPLWAVQRSLLKWWPVRFSCQIMIDAAIRARGDGLDARAIRAVEVATYADAAAYFARSPELAAPRTRESADHSLAFCVAAGLLDGHVGPESFERKRFLDDDAVAVMSRIDVVVRDEFTEASRDPGELKSAITVTLTDGTRVEGTAVGATTPPDATTELDRISAKLDLLASPVLGSARTARIRQACLGLRDADSVRPLIDLLSTEASDRDH